MPAAHPLQEASSLDETAIGFICLEIIERKDGRLKIFWKIRQQTTVACPRTAFSGIGP